MSSITYIMGAGASVQSMPLVKNFPERFEVFVGYLDNYGFGSCKLLNDAFEFKRQIRSHFSFDTFFKKLFHQSQFDQILKFKKVLLIFFLFEHLVEIDEYDEIVRQTRVKVSKSYKVDPRYEALIAGLLKPIQGRIEFYTDINFFTWNYDVNLLIALKNFIAPNELFSKFVTNSQEGNLFKLNGQVNVAHLNGFTFHPLLDEVNRGTTVNIFIEKLVKEYDTSSPELAKYANAIHFSWESNGLDHAYLQQLIGNSNFVIVVGYSLPLYNRRLDTYILNADTLRRKNIIVQDLAARDIGSILESDFGIPLTPKHMDHSSVSLFENCGSFIVPRQIFNY